MDQQWVSWLRDRRLVTDSTVTTYERGIARLEKHAGVPRDQITVHHLSAFARNGYSLASKEQSIVAFRIRHRWGADRGLWSADPEVLDFRLPRRRNRTKPALSSAEASALLSAAKSPVEVRTFFGGLYAGLRLEGIESLDEASWQPGIITIEVKSSWEPLQIPVHPELDARREEILSARPSRKQIQRACKRFRSVVNLPITTRWLRRTFSQHLRRQGTALDVIGGLLGHSPASVTEEFYAPRTWEEMAAELGRLSYGRAQLSLF